MLNKIKATRKNWNSYQRSYCTKVPTLKDKELNLNADLSKKSVTVSAKGFEGEVTLKFEIETQSAKSKDERTRKQTELTKPEKKLRYTNWNKKLIVKTKVYQWNILMKIQYTAN
ncbi:hypothetical protein HYD58_03875 [Mycoplasmopsis bovis]|nr:hypothetical protein [Mycoplasmopsis bovis]QQH66191.1 hypothetical protein HYD58_03875 [Mycoplasmopsis bovis]